MSALVLRWMSIFVYFDYFLFRWKPKSGASFNSFFFFFYWIELWHLLLFLLLKIKLERIIRDFFLPFKPRVKFSRNWNHCNSKLYDNSYLLIKTLYQHLRASWKEQPAKCLKTFVLSFDRLIKSDFLYREMQLSLCIQSTESGHVRHHQLLLPLVLV